MKLWLSYIARYITKKTLLAVAFSFVFLFAALAVVLVRNYSTPENQASADTQAQTLSEEQKQRANADSDGDGLKDWEEAIFQTDPNKADTDGDGTPDGKEIADGRNPLKAGPGDQLEPPKIEISDEMHNYADLKDFAAQGNITQMLSQQILENHGVKEVTDIKNANNISDEMAAYLARLKEQSKPFTPDAIPDSRLTIEGDSSAEAVKAYFNAMAEVYAKYASSRQADDVGPIQEAFQQQSDAPLAKLQDAVNLTGSILADMQAVRVPASVVWFHKKELWYLQNTIGELTLLKQASVQDPLYILLLVNIRKDTKTAITDLHNKEIPAWLIKNNIIFTAWDKAAQVYPVPIQ